MNSKESLENWYNTQSPTTKAYEYELHYRIIKKDLEVLEILKNILKIKKSDLYGFEIVVRGSDEQENKIKEWLEE